MTNHTLAVAAATALAAFALAAPARADVDARGNFSTRVSIDVPSYYTLTPPMALVHHGGPTGIAGAGWSLEAGSTTITRTSAAGGTPRFIDDGPEADRFWLDGEQLVPCAAGSISASCTTAQLAFGSSAGFYSTRIESFVRVQRTPTGWLVWERDGTVRTYLTWGNDVAYEIYDVTDTHGNRVEYKWACPTTACTLEAIMYGQTALSTGTQIQLYYESRPDPRTVRTMHGIARHDQRLRSIVVTNHGLRLRAYRLDYTVSQNTGASLLASVQQFPWDANVTSTGEVTAGLTPPLPPVTFGTAPPIVGQGWTEAHEAVGLLAPVPPPNVLPDHYGPGTNQLVAVADVVPRTSPPRRLPHGSEVGDFDGDRRSEVLVWGLSDRCGTITASLRLSTGSGVATVDPITTTITGGTELPSWENECTATAYVADIDGDGRDDLLIAVEHELRALLGRPDGVFVAGPTTDRWPNLEQECGIGDLDGDGRTDLACTEVTRASCPSCEKRSTTQLDSYRYAPAGWQITHAETTLDNNLDVHLAVGDLDADGLADVVLSQPNYDSVAIVIAHSRGDGSYDFERDDLPNNSSTLATLQLPDLDGDGRADIAIANHAQAEDGLIHAGLSRKGSVAGRVVWQPPVAAQLHDATFADLNGDGRADLLGHAAPFSQSLSYRLALPGGGFGPVVPRGTCGAIRVADLDGDGLADAVCVAHAQLTYTIDDRRSQPSDANRHRWLRSDVDGDGSAELVDVTFANPGYTVKVVWPATGAVVTQTYAPGVLAGLTEPNAARWLAIDVGSSCGAFTCTGPDGKVDLVLVEPAGGDRVRITTLFGASGGFGLPVQQETAISDPDGDPSIALDGAHMPGWQPADLDGDGTADLIRLRPNLRGAGVIVDAIPALGGGAFDTRSRATVYFDTGSVAPLVEPTARSFVATDVDGDGRTDLVHLAAVSGGAPVIRTLRARSRGGFDELVATPAIAAIAPASWRTVDLDGDGNVDLVHAVPVTVPGQACIGLDVLSGDGAGGFTADPRGTACVDAGGVADGEARLFDDVTNLTALDADGDGRPELVHVTHQILGSQARSLQIVRLVPPASGTVWSRQIIAVAVAGDLGDAWSWQPMFDPVTGTAALWHASGHEATLLRWPRGLDELTTIDNHIGLLTTVARARYTGARHGLPHEVSPRVVASISTADRAYDPPVTDQVDYHFDRPAWSVRDQQLIGFAERTSTDARAKVAETFELGDACGAQPATRTITSREGETLAIDRLRYLPPGAVAPYRCLADLSEHQECAAGACRLAEQVWIDLDDLGNLRSWRSDAIGARTIIKQRYTNPNFSAYILDRPRGGVTQEWDGSDWVLVDSWAAFYDHTIGAPIRGDATTVLAVDNRLGEVRTTKRDYDTHGNLTDVDSPGGRSTHHEIDPISERFVLSTCLGTGPKLCASATWDYRVGAIETETDANGALTITRRDPHARVFEIAGPATTTRTHYLAAGRYDGPPNGRQRLRRELADGSADRALSSEAFYDGAGRTYRTVREGGVTVSASYHDGSSRPGRVSDPYAGDQPGTAVYATYKYDAAGRLLSEINPDGSHVDTVYELGQITVTDELGAIRRHRLDGRGRATEVDEVIRDGTQATTLTTRYGYDGSGRMLSIVDPAGHATTAQFSMFGQLTDLSDPDRGARTFHYHPDGELQFERDALGQQIEYFYDSLGRIKTRTDTDASGAIDRAVAWTYDDVGFTHGFSRGRLVLVEDSQHRGAATAMTTELWYDLAGRARRTRTCVAGPCFDQGRDYDTAGRLGAIVYPDASGSILGPNAERVEYVYTDAGDLESVGRYATFDYYPNGKLWHVIYGNEVQATHGYDQYDRRLASLDIDAPKGSLLRLAYTHDAAGRIDTHHATGAQTADLTYHYDDVGRLETVESSDPKRRERIAYDAIGRVRDSDRLGTVRYDDPLHVHAVTSTDAGAARGYDRLGNVISMTDSSGRALAPTWTVDGHAATIVDTARGDTYRFGYDLAGHRAHRVGPRGTTRYFGPDLELDASGKLVKYYSGNGMLLARNDGDVHYFHADAAHATRIETDARARVANSYDYLSFGEPYQVPEAVDHDIRFSGARTDDDLGLVSMGARIYDPMLGRFLSADSVIPEPLRPQSLDRYSYVENDPINHWDPSGHMRLDIEMMMERKQQMRALWQPFAQALEDGARAAYALRQLRDEVVMRYHLDNEKEAAKVSGMVADATHGTGAAAPTLANPVQIISPSEPVTTAPIHHSDNRTKIYVMSINSTTTVAVTVVKRDGYYEVESSGEVENGPGGTFTTNAADNVIELSVKLKGETTKDTTVLSSDVDTRNGAGTTNERGVTFGSGVGADTKIVALKRDEEFSKKKGDSSTSQADSKFHVSATREVTRTSERTFSVTLRFAPGVTFTKPPPRPIPMVPILKGGKRVMDRPF